MKRYTAVVFTAAVSLGLIAPAGAQKNSEADTLLAAAQQKEMAEPANPAAHPKFDPPAEDQAEVPTIKFDKVTFKPCNQVNLNTRTIGTADSWGRHCEPIRAVIGVAYTSPSLFHLSGLPDWATTEPYDFQAKVAAQDVTTWQNMNVATRRIMVRNMLAEVLHLKVHAVTELRPMYALVVAPGGLKLTEYKDGDSSTMPNGQVVTGGNIVGGGDHVLVFQGMGFRSMATGLTARLDWDVVDKTGLTGRYNFTLQVPRLRTAGEDPEERKTFTAATLDNLKQFGLELKPEELESTTVVVDHIDRPPVADQPSE